MPTRGKVRLSRAQQRAVAFYLDGACVRTPNQERRSEEGHRNYKKGWEIRFYASSRASAAAVGEALEAAGLTPGRPYPKHGATWIVPMYGRDQVSRFLSWVEGTADPA